MEKEVLSRIIGILEEANVSDYIPEEDDEEVVAFMEERDVSATVAQICCAIKKELLSRFDEEMRINNSYAEWLIDGVVLEAKQ